MTPTQVEIATAVTIAVVLIVIFIKFGGLSGGARNAIFR